MTTKVSRKFLEQLQDISRWYASQSPEILPSFEADTTDALQMLGAFPFVGSGTGTFRRRLFLKRFPYVITYELGTEYIKVLTIVHTRREPGIRDAT
jgi:plasmid stabilization system protein ParE